MKGKVKCTCGWSWNKSDSSAKDMYICHECGRDNSNNMKNGGWLDNIPQAQEGTQTTNSRQKKGVELLLKETEKANKDKKELLTTGQVKNPRSIEYKKQKKELEKRITDVHQDNRTDYVKNLDQEKGQAIEDKKQFKKNVVAPLDVATDIMQLGNFVPHPYGQIVGEIGNVAGSALDAYQAYDDLSEGNYTDAAINAGSVFLPMALGSQTFRRNSKYLQPGQPLYPFSSQANLPANATMSMRLNAPQVNYIEPFTKVKGMTDTSLLANRGLLGTLGAETIYDASGMVSEPEVTPTINKNKVIQYYNTDPKRGEVEKPGDSSNVKYVPVSNSAELKKWKKQKLTPIDSLEPQDLVRFPEQLPKADFPIIKQKNGGWLDAYNEEVPQAQNGIEGTMGGLTDKGFDYNGAWGGQFQEGGDIPMAQSGKATRADSLDVYNRALKIDAYYNNLKKKGWYPKRDIYPVRGMTSKQLEEEMKRIDKESRKTYKEQSEESKQSTRLRNVYPNADPKKANLNALAEHIKLTRGTKYASKDNFPSIIDPMAPTTVIDTRIIPKEKVVYETLKNIKTDEFYKKYPNPTKKQREDHYKQLDKLEPPSGTAVSLYRYDPLSVIPFDILLKEHPELIPERIKKYGTDGVPQSYIDQITNDGPQKDFPKRNPIQALQNNLQPEDVVSNFDIEASTPITRREFIAPKYYNVEDVVNRGKSQTNYKWYPQNQEALRELSEESGDRRTMTPIYQDGGSMPGAVGFTYARTQGIPSEGPYAKKTMASAQGGKKIKIKDEREQVIKPSESTGVKKRDFDLEQSKNNKAYISAVVAQKAAEKKEAARRAKLTKEQREREDYNAYNEQRGSINKYTPETTWQRTKAVVSNPMTAAGYIARGENLPGNFQAGPRNAHDYAVDWINPLQGAVALSEIPGELSRGEFLEAGLSGLDALDLGVYARGAMKVAKPLMKPIKKTLAKGALKTFEKARDLDILAKDAIRGIDDAIIYPIKYRKQIADIKKLHSALASELESDEAVKRLSEVLKIDPTNLNYPSITTFPRIGSHYDSMANNINMDFRQLNQFKNSDEYMLSPNTVYDHEVGHWMQAEAYKNSPDYARELDNYKQELAEYEKQLSLHNSPDNKALENMNHDNATQEELRHWFLNYIPKPYKPRVPFPIAAPTKIDRFAQQLYGYDKSKKMINIDKVSNPVDMNLLESNARYFTNRGVEPLAHLREMRQNMLTKDYIKDKYGPISEEIINKFISENPTDRVSSFTIPGSNQVKGLVDIFKNLPSVVGPSVIGAGAAGTAAYQMQDEEPLPGMRRGGVIRDDRGQWAHPGEITEIGSNQITMQGVPYPVLGISDEGDTKLMKPGKNYKFKGKKVTEFPMAKNGVNQADENSLVKLDQLTNFTNYNKPQPGGWLSKYE